MTRKMMGGLAALGIVGAISTLLAPGAMAQGYGNRGWHDGSGIRQDRRVVRHEDHRIAADRAALRHDRYTGNHFAAARDRNALHHDTRVRNSARFDANVDRHDWHHHY